MIVYLITNTKNGKRYVGQTTKTLAKRWSDHRARSKKSMLPLHCAIRKYGVEVFDVVPIWFAESKQELNEMESGFIAALGTQSPVGYNLTGGGEGCEGYKHTAESLAKMSVVHIGNTYRKGATQSQESRNKMSISHTGLKQSAETVAKRAAKVRGQRRTSEVCNRLSESAKLRDFASHFPEDRGAFLRGKPWPAARRAAYESRG